MISGLFWAFVLSLGAVSVGAVVSLIINVITNDHDKSQMSPAQRKAHRRRMRKLWIILAVSLVANAGVNVGKDVFDNRDHSTAQPKDSSGASQPSSPKTQPTAQPTADEPMAPPNPNLPYWKDAPAKRHIPNTAPFVEFSFYTITNRGKLVAIPITGQGFTANSSVSLEVFGPDGGTDSSTGYDTDDRGIFSTSYGWVPLQYEGIEGTNGQWRFVFTDRASGQKTTRALIIKSDAQTPEPSQWDRRDKLDGRRSGKPTIQVSTDGTLCVGRGVRTTTSGKGFTPGGTATLKLYRSDGLLYGSHGLFVNGDGAIDNLYDYWTVSSCSSGIEYSYTFVISDPDAQLEARSTVLLPSKP